MTITSTTTQATIRSMAGMHLAVLVDDDGRVIEYEVQTPSRYSVHSDRRLAHIAYADALESEAARLGDVVAADRLTNEAVRVLLSIF